MEMEHRQAEAERQQAEAERQRQHELEMKKLEIAAKTSGLQESGEKLRSPKVDWQAQLRKLDSRNDDISLYLVHFERVMKRVQMPCSMWMACLINQLPSEIVQMIMREPEEQAENYDHVKSLLLKRYRLSPEKFRQLFFSHHNTGDNSWKEYYHELETYFNGWIMGLEVETFEQLKDLIITDQMKRRTPTEIREHYFSQWASLSSPVELAEKIDEYIELREVFKNKAKITAPSEEMDNERTFPKERYPTNITRNDGRGTKEYPVKSAHPYVNATTVLHSSLNNAMATKTITVDGEKTQALLDTAAEVSMLKYSFAKKINARLFSGAVTSIRGVGGLRKSFGIAISNVEIDSITLRVEFYVVPDDTFDGADVLIGNDVIDSPNLVLLRKAGKSKLLHIGECNFLQNFQLDETPQRAVPQSNESVTMKPGGHGNYHRQKIFGRQDCGSQSAVTVPSTTAACKSLSDDTRKLFVGGINQSTKREDLKEYFSNFGEVINAVIKNNPNTGKSRGFGFVTFSKEEALIDALKNAPHTVIGKTVELRRAKPRQGITKIFVGGLEADYPESNIKTYFEKYGKVTRIELPFDKLKKRRRRFCFVIFETEDACKAACRLAKQKIGVMECDVMTAKSNTHRCKGGLRCGVPTDARDNSGKRRVNCFAPTAFEDDGKQRDSDAHTSSQRQQGDGQVKPAHQVLAPMKFSNVRGASQRCHSVEFSHLINDDDATD